MDNRTTIVEEILSAENEVKEYIIKELKIIRNHSQADEILAMHIHPLIQKERLHILKQKIETILLG